MISLRKAATEMERVEALRACFSECYRLAIRAAAEYTVELDRREASDFRDNLETLADRARAAETTETVRQVQGAFRTALRGYRDQAQSRLDHLRQEVEASAAALAAFAGNIALQGSDHHARMDAELERLRQIMGWDDLAQIRNGVRGVVSGIADAVTQMQRANQMTIAQLRDEIRTLHQSLAATERAAATDAATGAWNRQKSERRMQQLLKENETFRVLMISVTNFKRVEGRFPPCAVEGALKQMIRRLREIVGAEPAIGRWNENQLVVLLDLDPAGAMALSREASVRLSTAYSLPDGTSLKPVQLEVATGLVERPSGADTESFLKKLEQLSMALVST